MRQMIQPNLRAVRVALAVRRAAISALLITAAASAASQDSSSLADSLRQPWRTYVFVSTHMPHRSLVDLAREASLAHAILVLRGFDSPWGQPVDLARTQAYVGQINRECCAAARLNPPHWAVDPKLFDFYRVHAAPTFVVAAAGRTDSASSAMVSGDMALASALKFIAQQSRYDALRQQAARIYERAFGGRP